MRWKNKGRGKKALLKKTHYKCAGCGKWGSSTRWYKIYYCEECELKGLRSKRHWVQALWDYFQR